MRGEVDENGNFRDIQKRNGNDKNGKAGKPEVCTARVEVGLVFDVRLAENKSPGMERIFVQAMLRLEFGDNERFGEIMTEIYNVDGSKIDWEGILEPGIVRLTGYIISGNYGGRLWLERKTYKGG